MNTSTNSKKENDDYKNFFEGKSNTSGSVNSSDGYKNIFLHGLGTALDSYSNLLTFNYLNVSNDILKIIYDQMNLIVPSGDEVADAKKLQDSILERIGTLSQTPEFQEKWKELTRSLAELLNQTINQVLDIIDEEGEEVINKVGKVANRTIMNLTATAVDTAQDALSVIPGLDVILAVFTLFTSAITDGSNSMLTALTLFNSMIELIGKMTNSAIGIDSKLIDISTQIQDFIKLLQTPGQEINDMLDKVDKFNNIPDTSKSVSTVVKPLEKPTKQNVEEQILTQQESQIYNSNPITKKNRKSLTGGKRKKRTRKRKYSK